MNIYINKLNPSHHKRYIIWTWTTTGYLLFGHKLLDIHYLDIDYCWKYIIWTYTITRHTLLYWIWTKPQLDMDYFELLWTHPITGHMTLNQLFSNIGHHLIYIIIMFNSSFNQSYSIKHIIYLFQPLSQFLDFGLYLFRRLKNAPEAIGLCSLMSSFEVNSPKQIQV